MAASAGAEILVGHLAKVSTCEFQLDLCPFVGIHGADPRFRTMALIDWLLF